MIGTEAFFPISLIISIIIVSIPEELFLVLFSLILLKRYDLIELKKDNIFKISIPVVITAVASNILRYYLPSTKDYIIIIGIIIIVASIIIIYGLSRPKEIIKVIICTLLSMIVYAVIQTAYVPLLLYGTSVPIEELNKPGLLIFIWSLPERAIEFSILSYFLSKKKSFLRVNLIKVISDSPKLTMITTVVLLFNILFIAAVVKVIGYERVLVGLRFDIQIIFIVCLLLLPVLNLAALFIAIYYIKDRDALKRFNIQQELNVSISDIRFFLKRREYDRIEQEMVFLERDTGELFKDN